MKNEHIISLIDNTRFASLSESDLAAIRDHTVECVSCHRVFEAARVSSVLLKQRVAESSEIFEPSPFFHTRVMASLRERQANDFWAWTRLWKTAGALASSMVATVAALAVLTFVIPGNQVPSGPQEVSLPNSYSAEEVILDQNQVAENAISDGQLLTEIYGAEDDPVR